MCVQESSDLDVLQMRLETLQKQVEDQQEHIRVLRDTVSLKDRQADMLHSDVMRCLASLHANTHTSKHNYYGRPLSVSTKRASMLYFANVLFIYLFYGRLILRPWLTEVRESFTRGGPWVSLEKLLLGFFPGHP